MGGGNLWGGFTAQSSNGLLLAMCIINNNNNWTNRSKIIRRRCFFVFSAIVVVVYGLLFNLVSWFVLLIVTLITSVYLIMCVVPDSIRHMSCCFVDPQPIDTTPTPDGGGTKHTVVHVSKEALKPHMD